MGDEYVKVPPGDDPDGRFPDRRKHGYKELEGKLDEHVKEIEDRFRRFFIMAIIAFAVIGLTSAGALVGYGVLLRQQTRTSSEIQRQTILIQRQADIIQQQRRDSVRETCEAQNSHHNKTFQVLDKVFKRVLANTNDPNQKVQIAASRQYNELLINALAPKQDCSKLVQKAVPAQGGP